MWATLIARLFEIFPLTCPRCGAEMKIIAFVTERPSVQVILTYIDGPTRPAAISPERKWSGHRSDAWLNLLFWRIVMVNCDAYLRRSQENRLTTV